MHESLLHFPDERPGHLDVRVEPRDALVTRIVVHGNFVETGEVFVARVAPGHEGQLAVDDHQLAMVSLLQAGNIHLLVRLDWVHRENLDVVFSPKRLDERIETPKDLFVRVERVDHEPDLHASARPLDELHDQVLGEVAGPDHVELKVNGRDGPLDCGKEPLPRFARLSSSA